MKKLLGIILVLCMLAAAGIAAAEETTIEARRVELNTAAKTLLVLNDDRTYHVADLTGSALSGDYAYGKIRDGMYVMTAESEYAGNTGLLDGQGQVVIPMEYFSAEGLSDRWAVGQLWAEATAEEYDVKVTVLLADEPDKYYKIDTVDVFYRGEKKGSLTRMEYDSATAYGDYLCVTDRENNKAFYNKDMEKSAFEAQSRDEYYDDYKAGKVVHQGSGQAAFTAGCTLTADEVKEAYWLDNDKQVLDLEGNVMADLSAYYSAYKPVSGLVKIRNEEGLYGLADVNGKELLPCLYTEIGYDLECAKAVGYIYAARDGKAGFVSLADGTEAGFTYPEDAVRKFAAWLAVEDKLNGVTYAVSADPAAEVTSWKEVHSSFTDPGISNTLAIVVNEEGQAGVLNLKGEQVVPVDGTYSGGYSKLTVSDDGTVILGNPEGNVYKVYQLAPAE